jgi:hypothetical protein
MDKPPLNLQISELLRYIARRIGSLRDPHFCGSADRERKAQIAA